jgi:germination protein M
VINLIRSVTGTRLVILVAVVALAAACSPSAGSLGSIAAPTPTDEPSVELPSQDSTPGIESPSVDPTASPAGSGASTPTASPAVTPATSGTMIVRAYFFLGSFTGNAGLAPVLREVTKTKAVANAAVQALLGGPQGKEINSSPAMYTDVPDGTRLLGLSIADGVATVNLSQEFASDGERASFIGRLAQVVYTLTQFPSVDKVAFELDGQRLTAFGDLDVLEGPVGRSDYHLLPAIFVDRPAWGAAIGNPARVSGLANVFEATFRVQVLDGGGRTLVDQQVMASCGTGCWGTFSKELPYSVSKAQWGTLRVFDRSAKDGSPENVTEYPVWLTPAS